MIKMNKRAAVAALAGLLSLGLSWRAEAAMSDYAFQLVESAVKKGAGAIVSVRLVDTRTGKTVPDAVIFETRADMAPDGMASMTTPIEALPSEAPGIYRFKVDLVMQGGWQISLGAKIQGEEGTLEDKLVLKATE